MPPLLNIPARTTDLEVAQQAGELVLRWTVPALTSEGFAVKDLDRVVVLGLEVDGAPVDPNAFQGVARELANLDAPKPGERIERRLPPPVPSGKKIAIAVKNVNHRGRTLGVSNIVVVEVAPPIAAPKDLRAMTSQNAIRLEWSPVAGARGYRVFRGEGAKPEFTFLTAVEKPPFNDSNFEWDKPYSYFLRAYVEVSSGIAESADSNTAQVVPHDEFPPTPPQGLQAVVTENSVELSWNLSPEADTVGYNIYRRDAAGQSVRLNSELLAAPVFSDKAIQPQQKYVYTVTAADAKGNESAPGAPVEVMVP